MALAELVVVRVVAQPSFDIELITLVDILLHDLGKLPVEQEVMLVGMIGDLRPILRRIATLCGGKRHLCHSLVSIIIMDIGVLTDVANKHHLIHSVISIN